VAIIETLHFVWVVTSLSLVGFSEEHNAYIFRIQTCRVWNLFIQIDTLGGIPVPTAWHVLGSQMEERPPDMEVSCEYIE
jgi:hypothetical protein